MDKAQRDIVVFGYGLGLIAAFFGVGGVLRHGLSWASVTLMACAIIFTAVTALRREALRPGYRGWMVVAHFMGSIVTTLVLGGVFFLVFAPVGIILRLVGKDHLQRKIDREAATYWQRCSSEKILKERYLQQF